MSLLAPSLHTNTHTHHHHHHYIHRSIHIAPAAFLGLHWRALRGEAVLAGMVSGLAVTLGLVFSPLNVALEKGSDSLACGLSTALVGFFVNITVTVTLGLLLQRWPNLFGDALAAARRGGAGGAASRLDVGPKRDRALRRWWYLAAMALCLLFSVPFCFRPGSRNRFVGDMAAWAFASLFLSGLLAVLAAACFLWLTWEDYEDPGAPLPSTGGDAKALPPLDGKDVDDCCGGNGHSGHNGNGGNGHSGNGHSGAGSNGAGAGKEISAH